jgi:hypothetical protein
MMILDLIGSRSEPMRDHQNTRPSSKSLMKTREKILPPGIPSAGIQDAV